MLRWITFARCHKCARRLQHEESCAPVVPSGWIYVKGPVIYSGYWLCPQHSKDND